jgi:hypothetical protein
MKTFSMSVLAFGVAVSASAFAAQGGSQTSMTLEGLKDKCTELSANEQLKPFKAVVTCKQVATEWRPAAESPSVEVQNSKQIGASFSLKGYAVPFQAEDVEVGPATAACTVLEQYKLTVPAVDIELDCAGLQAVQKLTDLCGPAIDERVTADPSIQIEEATGVTFNSCNPNSQTR